MNQLMNQFFHVWAETSVTHENDRSVKRYVLLGYPTLADGWLKPENSDTFCEAIRTVTGTEKRAL